MSHSSWLIKQERGGSAREPARSFKMEEVAARSARRPAIGELGEQAALDYLAQKHLKLHCRNWRCNAGEIDIIMLSTTGLVFVEVKTRVDTKLARVHLLDNITERKRRKLRQLVGIYQMLNRRGGRIVPARIDVVGVLLHPGDLKPVKITHLVSAC